MVEKICKGVEPEHTDSSERSAQPIGVYALIPFFLAPIVLAFGILGPGWTGDDGFIIRLFLGYIWVIGGFAACWLASTCLVNSVYSQNIQRKSISTLAGYGFVVLYAALWLFLTYPTDKRITSMVNNNIPVGSSRDQVEAFLDAENITFAEESGKELRATIPGGFFGLDENWFDVYLYFDRNNKMRKFEVQRWDSRTE